jgi:uncharacterized protein YndB with AHSA1/START domain
MAGLVATAEIDIDAPRESVWAALTARGPNPEIMFGAEVVSDWTVGSSIYWRGEWNGTSFEDKGEVVEVDAPGRLVVTHFSPMTGEADVPENYHRLEFVLTDAAGGTHLSLSQDNNPDQDAADHAAANWRSMLEGVKAVAERS